MRSVLVAREFDAFSRILRDGGFAVINCPVIETAESDDLTGLEERIRSIENYDAAIFTSPRAAEIFLKKREMLGGGLPRKIYALGGRTRKIFESEGIAAACDEKAGTASEMIASIPKEELIGRRLLFVRGRRSMMTVPELLGSIAEVVETIVYDTRSVEIKAETRRQIEKEAAAGTLAAACFFSPSGAESMLEQIDPLILANVSIAAIGRTTAGYLKERGIKTALISEVPEAEAFARRLAAYLGRKDRLGEKSV